MCGKIDETNRLAVTGWHCAPVKMLFEWIGQRDRTVGRQRCVDEAARGIGFAAARGVSESDEQLVLRTFREERLQRAEVAEERHGRRGQSLSDLEVLPAGRRIDEEHTVSRPRQSQGGGGSPFCAKKAGL